MVRGMYPQPYEIIKPLSVNDIIDEKGQIYAICKETDTEGSEARRETEEKKDERPPDRDGAGKEGPDDAEARNREDKPGRSNEEGTKPRSRTPMRNEEVRDDENTQIIASSKKKEERRRSQRNQPAKKKVRMRTPQVR